MKLDEILNSFEGKIIDLTTLTKYEQWALGFFHSDEILSPNLEMCLQLDISDANELYRLKYQNISGNSFTGHLTWHLLQTIKEFPAFSWREIDNKWYSFSNLPLFIPVAVGGKERFNDVIIENISRLNYQDFVTEYRQKINQAKNQAFAYQPHDPDFWHLGHFIGNLPNLKFSSLTIHQSKRQTGRPMFYLGKRYEQEFRMMLPFYVRLNHSNTDPVIFDQLLARFQQRIATEL